MKKVIAVILILVMIMALAACGKKEDPSASGNSDITQAVDNTKDTEPTKAAEPTTEPTAVPTPEPTAEPEPTAGPEPTDEPSGPEDDEFYSAGHVYDGLWQCDNVFLAIDAEGAADVITVYSEETNQETFGSWIEFWTNFDEENDRFIADGVVYYDAESGSVETTSEEGTYTFEIVNDYLYWAEMVFEKVADDTSNIPYIVDAPSDPFEGMNTFGTAFVPEYRERVDVVATTYFGVYLENLDDHDESFYYPYYGEEMSMETLDEFNCAFLDLGVEQDQGQFCFLEKGLNADINWEMEDGGIKITYLPTGDFYFGTFFWDNDSQRMYLSIPFLGCTLWLSDDRTIASDSAKGGAELTETMALVGIENYCYANNPTLEDYVNEGEYSVYWMVESNNDDQIVVLFRSYTGAYLRFYIDKVTGDTYVTEFVPMISDKEEKTDQTFNVWNYID